MYSPLLPIEPAVADQVVPPRLIATPNWSLPAAVNCCVAWLASVAGVAGVTRDARERLVHGHVHAAGGRNPARIGDRDQETVAAGLGERGRGVLAALLPLTEKLTGGRRRAGGGSRCRSGSTAPAVVGPQDREGRRRAGHHAGRARRPRWPPWAAYR